MAARRFYRSRRDCMIAGVCGGLAEYFSVDPSLVRLVMVLTAFLGGAGLVMYLVAWLIVPENPEQKPSAAFEKNQRLKEDVIQELRKVGGELGNKLENSIEELETRPERRSTVFAALALIAIGAAFLLKNFIPWLEFEKLWPVLLIGAGVLLLIGVARRDEAS